MKRIFFLFAVLASLFAACNKANSNASAGNGGSGSNSGNGGNGGNGGGSDSLSIAGFSPQYPYTTDEITITGTGFNPDKTKDTVLVGFGGIAGAKPATINSATATQLKLVVPPDSVLLDAPSDFPVYALEIHANGKRILVSLDKTPVFKPSLVFTSFYRNVVPYNVFRPGDSVTIAGYGYVTVGSSCSIDGNATSIYKMDTSLSGLLSSPYQIRSNVSSRWAGFAAVPKLIFGEVNDETLINTKTVVFTNGDGKSAQKQLQFGMSPIMQVSSLYYETGFDSQNGYTYSLSGLNSTAGKIRLHIVGKYLKNNTDLEFYGRDFSNNIVSDAHSSLPVTGFPDSTVVEYGTTGLVAGYKYYVQLSSSNPGTKTSYGFLSFYMKP
jgi:hypothetical protein